MKPLLLLLLLVLEFGAAPALAAPAIQCHCFQDRSFNPAKPDALDPYLLATTRNSLFAIVFDQDKKTVVRARMSGTSAEDLWTTYFLAARAGVPADTVAGLRHEGLAWPAVVQQLRLSPAALGEIFAARLRGGADTPELAAAAVDTALTERLRVAAPELAALRTAGAGDAETVLAVFLGRKTGRSAADILTQVRGGETWGALYDRTGLVPAATEQELRSLIVAGRPIQ
jgi:hypothetical protein